MPKIKKLSPLNRLRNRRINGQTVTLPDWALDATDSIARTAAMTAAVTALSLVFAANAHAMPTGGSVTRGTANINQNGLRMDITQTSDKAIINWNGYNISANELVNYIQPSTSSISLNRVTGGASSSIMGQLLANGRVFIVNPNGIFFGSSANVDVGGLLATTMNIADDDFMNGTMNFTQGAGVSYVINQGSIHVADNGFVILVAPAVSNEGLIVASLGKVILGSGTSMTLDLNGDGLITYAVSGKVVDHVTGPDDQPMVYAVNNSGTIQAGTVLLTADAAGSLFSSVINNSGLIEARGVDGAGGSITLSGGAEGLVSVGGTLDASGLSAGQSGGTIDISGAMIDASGLVDASGAVSGGSVNIATTLDGGTIDMAGSIIARGGVTGGAVSITTTGSDAAIDISGLIDASGEDAYTDDGTDAVGGSGGSVVVSTAGERSGININGTINAYGGYATATSGGNATGGNGGSVTISTGGAESAITMTGYIDASGGDAYAYIGNATGGNGGNVAISTTGADSPIDMSNIDISANGRLASVSSIGYAQGGSGGTISISTQGDGAAISIQGSISAYGGAAIVSDSGYAFGGDGGAITINAEPSSGGEIDITVDVSGGGVNTGDNSGSGAYITITTTGLSNKNNINYALDKIQSVTGSSGFIGGSALDINVAFGRAWYSDFLSEWLFDPTNSEPDKKKRSSKL